MSGWNCPLSEGLRHFACLRQAASNPNTRIKHRNLAKRLARERAALIIAGAGQFPVRYQGPSANTNFGRARKVTKTLVNDIPTMAARHLERLHCWSIRPWESIKIGSKQPAIVYGLGIVYGKYRKFVWGDHMNVHPTDASKESISLPKSHINRGFQIALTAACLAGSSGWTVYNALNSHEVHLIAATAGHPVAAVTSPPEISVRLLRIRRASDNPVPNAGAGRCRRFR
jgi:hypothetical protein